IAREINTNLTAPCLLVAHLLPALDHGRDARIVNVNSGLALAPKTDSAVYCATKAGLDTFSQSLRYQLEGARVRVQQAFLPLVDTGMTAGRGQGKLSAEYAAQAILAGIKRGRQDHDVGKVRILRVLTRWLPGLARRIMKAG
ncbi:MAG: SDR family NAD(P)-dependent oxidoreductase, partial [Pseudomonadota bacterium]